MIPCSSVVCSNHANSVIFKNKLKYINNKDPSYTLYSPPASSITHQSALVNANHPPQLRYRDNTEADDHHHHAAAVGGDKQRTLQDLCSCPPSVFTFTLNLTQTCDDNTIKGNTGTDHSLSLKILPRSPGHPCLRYQGWG